VKYFKLEASVVFLAEDLADACEQMAKHFTDVAAVHRGHSTDTINIDRWAPCSVCAVQPLEGGDVH